MKPLPKLPATVIEPPHYLTGPYSCLRCSHHDTYKPGTGVERTICRADPFETSCVFARARDGKGSCPDVGGIPKNFKERAI